MTKKNDIMEKRNNDNARHDEPNAINDNITMRLKSRDWSLVLFVVFGLAMLSSCSKEDEEEESTQPPTTTERYTGDSYGELNSPLVKNEVLQSHETLWSCLYFGSYPANEVVNGTFDAVDAYALAEGDIITDAALYAQLEQATWDEADDTEVNDRRYHRINALGAVAASGNRLQHYRWNDPTAWHYFAYAPIKWRVLNIKGSKALLLAHRMPDSHPFHDRQEDVSWSNSQIRLWLNSDFLDRAFSPAEREAIDETAVTNGRNYYFGTPCGPDTHDRVFLLSEAEVFASPRAVDYGFFPSDGPNDPARRFCSTLYAKCRGAWWSPESSSAGNSFWFLRTNGYTMANAVYVGDAGDIYNRGILNTCNDTALLPAITIDLSKAEWTAAASVMSSL